MIFKNEIGKSKVIDIKTSMHSGYVYDMPVVRHTLKNYTTLTRHSLVLNISDEKVFAE